MKVELKRISNGALCRDVVLGCGWAQSQRPTPIPNHPHIFLHAKNPLKIVVVFTSNMTISSLSVLLRYYLSLFVLFIHISI